LRLLSEVVVRRITVIKFGVNEGGSSSTGGNGIEVTADTTKMTDMILAGFGER